MIASYKHLLSIKELSTAEIEAILDRGDYWAHKPNNTVTRAPKENFNPIVCNLFFEASTRTRFSFEVASKKLGFHVLNFHPFNSSIQKGETLYDTLKTLESMGVGICVLRTPDQEGLQQMAGRVKLSLVNAGDGSNQHPTQALLDLLTLRQHFGRLNDLNVAIIGDIVHSRVAQSNIDALAKFDSKVMLSGPPELQPDASKLPEHVRLVDMDEAIETADVVMMLRVQKERHLNTISFEDYYEKYGLNKKREKHMPAHAMIMHPAPFNRGVEIDGDLVESPRSMIYTQVSNGVAVRMAVLEWLASGGKAF